MTDAKFCGCGLAMKNEIMCQCGLRGPWDTIDRYKPKTQKKPANKKLIKVLEKTTQEQSSLITKLGKQIAILKDCVEPLISRSGAGEPRIIDGRKAEAEAQREAQTRGRKRGAHEETDAFKIEMLGARINDLESQYVILAVLMFRALSVLRSIAPEKMGEFDD